MSWTCNKTTTKGKISVKKMTQLALSAFVLAAAQSASAAVVSKYLQPGDYVVTVGKPIPCRAEEINLKKEIRYNLTRDAAPEIILSFDSQVLDNLFHAEICMLQPELSKGTALVHVGDTSRLSVTDDLSIVAIEKITATEAATVVSRPQSYAAGKYIFDLEGEGSCRDSEVNIVKSLHYPEAMEPVSIGLQSNGNVIDDLVRIAICELTATSSASYYAPISTNATIDTGADDLFVRSVKRITATETIELQ